MKRRKHVARRCPQARTEPDEVGRRVHVVDEIRRVDAQGRREGRETPRTAGPVGPRPSPTGPPVAGPQPPDTPTIVTRRPGGADPPADSRRTRTVVIAVVALLVLAVLVVAAVIYLR